MSNIEFEAKLYKDVITLGCCTMFPEIEGGVSIPNNIKSEYYDLIDNITRHNNSTFTNESYLQWVNRFRQYYPRYNTPTSGDFCNTNVLNQLLSSCK